jgi:hypothetical protein
MSDTLIMCTLLTQVGLSTSVNLTEGYNFGGITIRSQGDSENVVTVCYRQGF